MKILVLNDSGDLGSLADGKVVNLKEASSLLSSSLGQVRIPSSILDLVSAPNTYRKSVEEITQAAAGGGHSSYLLPGERVSPRNPLPSTSSRLFCAGANFPSHQGRVRGMTVDEARKAIIAGPAAGFIKLARCVAGPQDRITYPSRTSQFDYEIEVAAIIGVKGKDIPKSRALEHVVAYTGFIDYSLRDQAGKFDGQPFAIPLAKNFDTAAALGASFVFDFGDLQNIPIELRVNGQVRQRGNTKEMVRSFSELIEGFSRDLTLYPGDLIASGTCAGTALEHFKATNDSALFLRPGDVIEAQSGEAGVIRNTVVAK